jgi:hypothetical protein
MQPRGPALCCLGNTLFTPAFGIEAGAVLAHYGNLWRHVPLCVVNQAYIHDSRHSIVPSVTCAGNDIGVPLSGELKSSPYPRIWGWDAYLSFIITVLQ